MVLRGTTEGKFYRLLPEKGNTDSKPCFLEMLTTILFLMFVKYDFSKTKS